MSHSNAVVQNSGSSCTAADAADPAATLESPTVLDWNTTPLNEDCATRMNTNSSFNAAATDTRVPSSDHSNSAIAVAAAAAAETAAAITNALDTTTAQVATAAASGRSSTGSIRILDASVVDRIAAGEVVQRAAAAVKEVLENALDAGATSVVVTVTLGALSTSSNGNNKEGSLTVLNGFTVADNGCGIQVADLPLVCTRHATSKLAMVHDLHQLTTYGFRGEALASISRVARVLITTKPPQCQIGHRLEYVNGAPIASSTPPTRVARTVGTTIVASDLFYNVPSRQRLRGSDEYAAVLAVVARYALHSVASVVATTSTNRMLASMACLKGSASSTTSTDLQTAPYVAALQEHVRSADPATLLANDDTPQGIEYQTKLEALREKAVRQVIGHAFGSHLIPHLLSLPCSALYDDDGDLETAEGGDEKKMEYPVLGPTNRRQRRPICTCRGYVTAPMTSPAGGGSKATAATKSRSCSSTGPTLILFINQVDGCPGLSRALQDVYLEFGSTAPWMYWSIVVPPDTVDVNIHPTKRHVALLHLDRIVAHLVEQLRHTLTAGGRSFAASSHGSTPRLDALVPTTGRNGGTIVQNPYRSSHKRKHDSSDRAALDPPPPQVQPTVKPAKSMVRTNRSMPSGALEPFLVPTLASQQLSQAAQTTGTPTNDSSFRINDVGYVHLPDCPLRVVEQGNAAINLSLPGAFAAAAAGCLCPGAKKHFSTPLPMSGVVQLPMPDMNGIGRPLRLQRVIPTPCRYTSIQQLRDTIQTQRDANLEDQLRNACLVGVVSPDRSLIQCGEHLVLVNHYACAQQLFYQMALFRFGGGCGVATLGWPHSNATTATSADEGLGDDSNDCGIDIAVLIGQFVQMEENLQHTNDADRKSLLDVRSIPVNETNQTLAEQATACLWQHAEMLLEYYSIRIEKNRHGGIVLTGLPVLLEGYEPCSFGLPLFLLRLATEVEWTQEKLCFHGICRELGSFYAQFPASDDGNDDYQTARIRHLIFPAISTLLIPLNQMQMRDFVPLTSLPKLYRVFERC
jgi:DNA mismatch repair protein MutL